MADNVMRTNATDHAGEELDVLTQDGSAKTYFCSPSSCGYTGATYCQNCGFSAGERA